MWTDLETANKKDFINYSNLMQDGIRVDIIRKVNRGAGLTFRSNLGAKMQPTPMSLEAFVMRSRPRENRYETSYYIPSPNVNKDNLFDITRTF